ncbi:MAG: hypothetical protein ACJ746_28135 [Bryobacteraceae bacterium]
MREWGRIGSSGQMRSLPGQKLKRRS